MQFSERKGKYKTKKKRLNFSNNLMRIVLLCLRNLEIIELRYPKVQEFLKKHQKPSIIQEKSM